jgi:hypothetical protein
MSHLQPFARFSETAFPSMLCKKVKSQEVNVVWYCIETHDICLLGGWPCRTCCGALVEWWNSWWQIDRLHRSWLIVELWILSSHLNKSHSRLETRQLTALVVANSFPSHWYSQMGPSYIEAVARCLLNAHLQHSSLLSSRLLLQGSTCMRLAACYLQRNAFCKTVSFPKYCYSQMRQSSSEALFLLLEEMCTSSRTHHGTLPRCILSRALLRSA